MKILFKDDKVFSPYDYSGQEIELEKNVLKHSQVIFGENSIFLEKTKIETWENETTIPDSFVILFNKRKWFIIEVELNEHSYKRHIVPQLLGFIGSIDNLNNKNTLINRFYSEIKINTELKSKIENSIEDELYKIISDIIHQPPEIIIIIDNFKPELKKLKSFLKFPYYVLEFQTFYTQIENETEFIHYFNIFNLEETSLSITSTRFFDLYPRRHKRKAHIPKTHKIPEIHINGGETLDQILEVVDLALNNNQTYNSAVKIIAKNRRIVEGTVRDKCTRKIGLITAEFKKLLKNKEKLADFLIKKFPNDENKISEQLLNF